MKKPEICDLPKRKIGKVNKPTKMNIQMKTAKAKQVLYKAIEDIFPKSFPFF